MRLDRGWSIYRLAELSGVSENTLYSWRDRGSSPTLYVIERIADAFGISPVYLLLKDEDFGRIGREEKELAECWYGLTAEQKTALLEMLRSFKRETD